MAHECDPDRELIGCGERPTVMSIGWRPSIVRLRTSIVLMLLALLAVVACTDDSAPAVMSGYEGLDEPLLVAEEKDGLADRWTEFAEVGVAVDRDASAVGAIPGFEPFNDPGILLSDGRFVLRGRWDGDQGLAGWWQDRPESVPEGEVVPDPVETSTKPVRLFVYDPETADLRPLSHVPTVYPYSTAVSTGASPDAVLDIVVLTGEQTVAYMTGFGGAAYDLPREIYVAPIPPK